MFAVGRRPSPGAGRRSARHQRGSKGRRQLFVADRRPPALVAPSVALTYGSGASRSETVAAGWELAIGVTLRRADDPVYAGLDAWRLSGDVSVLLVPDGDGYVGQVVGSTPVRAWRDGDVWTVRSDGALWTLASVASAARFETVRVEDPLGNVASVGWVDGRPDVVVLGGADPNGDGSLDAPATSEVRFVWEETEPWVSGSEGVVRRFDHRLAEVVVAAADGAPLHALVLGRRRTGTRCRGGRSCSGAAGGPHVRRVGPGGDGVVVGGWDDGVPVRRSWVSAGGDRRRGGGHDPRPGRVGRDRPADGPGAT
jgi:hypothetical protein